MAATVVEQLNPLAIALSLVGGAALGAPLGALVASSLRASGGEFKALVAGIALLGAVGAAFFAVSFPLPDLSSLMPKFGAARQEAELQRVLQTYYPQDWRQLAPIVAQEKAGQTDAAKLAALQSEVGVNLIGRQLPLASTDNTIAYMQVVRDEIDVLAKDPELCAQAMTDPGPDTRRRLVDALPDDLKMRETEVATRILEQTATHPQPPNPPKNQAQELQMWAMDSVNSLSFEERDALVKGGELRPKAICDASSSLIRMLTLMPGADQAEAFKTMSAKGFEQTSGA
jgi:hypothetical protein